MKISHLTAIVLPLALALCSGCMKMELTFAIAKNGSGEMDLNYSVTEQSVAQVVSILKLKNQMDAISGNSDAAKEEGRYAEMFLNPSEAALRKEFKKYETNGVTLTSMSVTSQNGKRQVRIKAAFKSLTELQKADFFAEDGFTLKKMDNDTYYFFKDKLARNGKGITAATDEDTAQIIRPLMAGMTVDIKIAVPGKIVKSNSASKSFYTAAWHYDIDKDPNALAQIENQQFKIFFDGAGLDLPNVQTKQPPKPAKPAEKK